MAQVVVLDGASVPAPEHWRAWSDALAAEGYATIRSGALSVRQAEQAGRAGLVCVQELSLLELVGPLAAARPRHRTHRLRGVHLGACAAIDEAAFGTRWTLDAPMLADVRRATPAHRSRFVRHATTGHAPAGFLISGRAGRLGYVQRLAVDPRAQRHGLAHALVADALRWMARAHVHRVYVNTHVDNAAALALYRRHGFTVLPERLRVFEGPTTR